MAEPDVETAIRAEPTIAEMFVELSLLARREAIGIEQVEILAARVPGGRVSLAYAELQLSQSVLMSACRLLKDLIPIEAEARSLIASRRVPPARITTVET